MASLEIASELRLVDGGEGELIREGPFAGTIAAAGLNWHAFGGAQHVARSRRDDPLLAGQQSDLIRALDGDDAVVNLARQEAKREADHPARVGAHPLDRQVGLAGIRRAENRPKDAVVVGGHTRNVAGQGDGFKAIVALKRS